MRVGFTGSHSTGKTSVAEFINNHVPGVFYVPSASRKVAAAGGKLNRAADRDDQMLTTVARVVDEQLAYEQNPKSIILSDRTPLDSLAYTKYQIDNMWDGDNDFFWDYSQKFVDSAMGNYDLVFYFPLGGFALTEDGVRESSEEYRTEIDKILIGLLEKTDLANPFVEVIDGTIEERAYFVRQVMRDYIKEHPYLHYMV